MGAPETPLEDKQLTVAYGADLVNISFINFSFNSKEITQVTFLFHVCKSVIQR